MLQDFVLELVNAPGTATSLNLAGAPTGRRTFAQAFSSGVNVFYYLDDGTQAEWGWGVFTAGSPNTVTRGVVIGNTAGTTVKLNFAGAGTRVYNGLPASNVIYVDQSGKVPRKISATMGTVPIGSGTDYFGLSLPAGYLWADGSAVSRTMYADLFAEIGTAYGVGNGSTTFNVPDKRGRISLTSDNFGSTGAAGRVTAAGSGIGPTLGSSGGSELMQAHAHGVSDPGHAHGISDFGHAHGVNDPGHQHHVAGTFLLNPGNTQRNTSFSGSFGEQTNIVTDGAGTGISIQGSGANVAVQGSGTGIGVQSAGAGNSQNMPPVLVCNYIIYAGV